MWVSFFLHSLKQHSLTHKTNTPTLNPQHFYTVGECQTSMFVSFTCSIARSFFLNWLYHIHTQAPLSFWYLGERGKWKRTLLPHHCHHITWCSIRCTHSLLLWSKWAHRIRRASWEGRLLGRQGESTKGKSHFLSHQQSFKILFLRTNFSQVERVIER